MKVPVRGAPPRRPKFDRDGPGLNKGKVAIWHEEYIGRTITGYYPSGCYAGEGAAGLVVHEDTEGMINPEVWPINKRTFFMGVPR